MPEHSGNSSLDVSAWHLQVLLTSLSSFDGKMMFLTALNVAGISALIGIALTADPVGWLFALSLSVSSLNVLAGLGRLWAFDSSQFPTPEQMRRTARTIGDDERSMRDEYITAIWNATRQGHLSLRRLVVLVRLLLFTTAAALAAAIATAVFAAY